MRTILSRPNSEIKQTKVIIDTCYLNKNAAILIQQLGKTHIASKAFLLPTKNESITIANLSIQLELVCERGRGFIYSQSQAPGGLPTLKIHSELYEPELS